MRSYTCSKFRKSYTPPAARIRVKIYGITKLKTNIIFLSDIRLSNKSGVTDTASVSRNFLVNPYCSYKFFYNSSLNKRGVGILIKNSIPISDVLCIKDPEENFLLLRLVIKGKTLILGSIYGPNNNDRNFFSHLGDYLFDEVDRFIIILGGNWNCTFSTEAVNDNIDILNMHNSPNAPHSVALREMCVCLKLADPFRILYPLRHDFTYVPRCVSKKK